MSDEIKSLLVKESMRMEEDTLHSMKGHYNAADSQNRRNKWLGLPAAIIAGVAGGTALAKCPEVTSVLAFVAAALASAMTFLKPAEKAVQHKASASRYHTLRNNLRRFREIEVTTTENIDLLKERLFQYGQTLNELNEISPQIPRSAYEQAKADIRKGHAQYHVDGGFNDG